MEFVLVKRRYIPEKIIHDVITNLRKEKKELGNTIQQIPSLNFQFFSLSRNKAETSDSA